MNAVLVGLSILSVAYVTYQKIPQSLLVAEDRASVSFKDGVLEFGGGRGWLRTPRVYLDFRLAFEFRTMTPETDAGVIVRSWTGTGGWPDRGYRLRLPAGPLGAASSRFVARREEVVVVEQGPVDVRPSSEWQQVEVIGEGRRIRMIVNGNVVGVFEIETFGGHILFDNRKGRVQLRKIRIVSIESDSQTPGSSVAFKAMTDKALTVVGSHPPKLIHEVRPSYTPEAMKRLVQGRVDMQVVVLPDGSPGAIRITRSLDPDLNLSAVAAVRRWKFKPGILHGHAVPVLVDVEVTFTLR